MIEEKFQFGNDLGELRQRDLEYLAAHIEESSGIRLSLSTLKRLWKKDYDKMPHPSTLQALVSVLGYKDWQDFKLQQERVPAARETTVSGSTPTPATAIPNNPAKQQRFSTWLLLPVIVVVALAIWLIAFRTRPSNKGISIKGPVQFTGNKTVSQGVPNTVIFHYDVTNVRADSFFFQQSWNPLDKVTIDPANHTYSSIYYYPGFHRAKLIANDSIIKRFRVHITTDGWLPLARYSLNDADPVYLRSTHIVRNGALHIDQSDLDAAGVQKDKEIVLGYFNIRDFGNTQSDNFMLDTRVRCDSAQAIACPGMEINITTEEHIFFMRLMGKGCERDIGIKMGEVVHNGINKDLSMFGRNMYQWQRLQIKVINKTATILLNEQPVYAITYKKDFGKIVGLVYNFTGTGAVDYVRLTNGENKQVYVEEFDH